MHQSAAGAGQATMEEIKANLKMAYVMEHYGHTPEMQDTDGKLHYFSPFREEDHPSFDVFSHLIGKRTVPEERYGDFADPDLAQGDVVDLVAKFESMDIGPAMGKARDILAEQIESGWAGPTVERSEFQLLDMSRVESIVDLARPLTASQTWLGLPRTHPGLLEVVLPFDRVFTHYENDSIVFVLRDEAGEVQGVRFRDLDVDGNARKYSVPGSHNILMRMEPPSTKPIFLAEGETDTWAAYGALHNDYEVMGVPGVGGTPQRAGADSLAGRVIYISFDPDKAGNNGRSIWAEYLASIGCDVRTVILPDGKDIAALNPEAIRLLPERARFLSPTPDGFVREHDQFGLIVWVGKGDDKEPRFVEKSNFSFTPHKILVGDDGARSYQGELRPSGKQVVLPGAALTSSKQLQSWGAPHQAIWYGSDVQVQQLAALLTNESAYLPEGRIHNQSGLYQGSFVWPGGHIGDQVVEWVPTVAEINQGPTKIFLEDRPVNPVRVFEALYESQNPSVTGPILAWLAAAPLRTRFSEQTGSAQFPFLSITGVSGSGKSALTDKFLRAFSSTNLSITLSSTTPYAVESLIDASSGFPIWFDEYRPGAKVDTMDRLNQLLRDGYTMQPSSKGGRDKGNVSKLTDIRTTAPIIVSGEDNFTEESHLERLVAVRLVQGEQGNLGALQDIDVRGFGYDYLTFLTNRPQGGIEDNTPPVFDRPNVYRPSGFDVKDRPERNLRVLQYGWALLGEYLTLFNPMFDMPELQLDRVVAAFDEAATSNPVLDLIKVCLENDTTNVTVWRWNDYLCVHPQNLVDQARFHPSIVLPVSGAVGISRLLQDKYGCGQSKVTPVPPTPGEPKRQARVLRIPWDMLGFTNDDDNEEDTNDNHSEI